MIVFDLCCGTASVGLACITHPTKPPPTISGFMGSKRRWRRELADALVGDRVVERLVLVDAGPWGDVWTTLRTADGRARVVEVLQRLAWRPLDAVWPELVRLPPPHDDAGYRAAQYLCLQARSAGTIPIWWEPERSRWESPTGSRTEDAHQRGGSMAATRRMKTTAEAVPAGGSRALGPARKKNNEGGSREVGPACLGHRPSQRGGAAAPKSRGLVDIGTLARRVQALERLPWDRIAVVHGRVEDVEPVAGATVNLDPPYAHSPRYAVLTVRETVLEVARRWAVVGARVAVAVSEAEPLPLGEGWSFWTLPGDKPEFVTARGVERPARAVQARLFEAGAA